MGDVGGPCGLMGFMARGAAVGSSLPPRSRPAGYGPHQPLVTADSRPPRCGRLPPRVTTYSRPTNVNNVASGGQAKRNGV